MDRFLGEGDEEVEGYGDAEGAEGEACGVALVCGNWVWGRRDCTGCC